MVQLNQGNTKDYCIVADIQDFGERSVLLKHEDELDAAGGWMPEACVHKADINHRDRALLLAAFADTKRGKEIVRSLTY